MTMENSREGHQIFNLLHPDVNNTVQKEQAKQKQNHDHHSRGRECFIGQNVRARNFYSGTTWTAGAIGERLGPLTIWFKSLLKCFGEDTLITHILSKIL